MIVDRVGAVVNPAAGGGDAARRFVELAGCFPEATVDARITLGPGDVPAATREQADWADLLAVVGGDGTLREVVAALLEADLEVPLFVVPAGRGNSTYRHLYGTMDWRTVARGLARGLRPGRLDVARLETRPSVDETYSVLGVTAGLFRAALGYADGLRMLPGPLAYVLATARAAIVDGPVELAVDLDDERVFAGAARLVAFGGGRYRGSEFVMLPDSRPDDGQLHVLVVEPTGLRSTLGLTRLARSGRIDDHPAVTYATGDTATLRSADGLPLEVDGTAVETPVESAHVSVLPGAVAAARPAQSPDR